jgi:hypothetical protein
VRDWCDLQLPPLPSPPPPSQRCDVCLDVNSASAEECATCGRAVQLAAHASAPPPAPHGGPSDSGEEASDAAAPPLTQARLTQALYARHAAGAVRTADAGSVPATMRGGPHGIAAPSRATASSGTVAMELEEGLLSEEERARLVGDMAALLVTWPAAARDAAATAAMQPFPRADRGIAHPTSSAATAEGGGDREMAHLRTSASGAEGGSLSEASLSDGALPLHASGLSVRPSDVDWDGVHDIAVLGPVLTMLMRKVAAADPQLVVAAVQQALPGFQCVPHRLVSGGGGGGSDAGMPQPPAARIGAPASTTTGGGLAGEGGGGGGGAAPVVVCARHSLCSRLARAGCGARRGQCL